MENYKELKAIFARWRKKCFHIKQENSSFFSLQSYWKLCKWLARAQRKCQGATNRERGSSKSIKCHEGRKNRNLCRAFSSCAQTHNFITSFLRPTHIPWREKSWLGFIKTNIVLECCQHQEIFCFLPGNSNDIKKHVSMIIKTKMKNLHFLSQGFSSFWRNFIITILKIYSS